jgi:hypothetical protein
LPSSDCLLRDVSSCSISRVALKEKKRDIATTRLALKMPSESFLWQRTSGDN